jgi:hypothetical protein
VGHHPGHLLAVLDGTIVNLALPTSAVNKAPLPNRSG